MIRAELPRSVEPSPRAQLASNGRREAVSTTDAANGRWETAFVLAAGVLAAVAIIVLAAIGYAIAVANVGAAAQATDAGVG